jgi:sensor c-di-GMP phosphodiesterase-like protein
MRILKHRIVLTLAATILAAACGTLAGYLLGRAFTLRHTVTKLDEYAMRIRNEGETSAGESRSLLATINDSRYPYCSDVEIAWMRKLIFQSEYLKDAGHMRDGRIDCSASLGRQNEAQMQLKPDFLRQDGTKAYLNLPALRVSDHTVVSIQLGDAFTVYSPYNLKDLASPVMHFTVSEVGGSSHQTGRLIGELPPAQGWILTRDGQTRVGDTLYVTRCSTHYPSCMTAYISIPEALQANRGEFSVFKVLSGLSGGLFGLACSLLYRRSRSMEQQLRRAVRQDGLRVVYQPIVNLATGQIVGAEALVRWTDEEGYAIGPDVFVKIAEERGFVGQITRLVVRHALRDFGEALRNQPEFRLSFNVAASDLSDPEFLTMLDTALARARVAPSSLAIEITESSTARHDLAIETIRELRQRGFHVHIDDFGTGYSSLSYLHALSIDAIKIDKSFTQAIGTEAVTLGILPLILSMAETLKLRVIVEGVETKLQAEYFCASAWPIFGQGWYFGRPVAADLFHRLLANLERNATVSTEQPKPPRSESTPAICSHSL